MEKWRGIEGFEPYEVSDHGRVRNSTTGHVLGVYDNGHGVMQVVMRRAGRNTARAVSRLVAEAFIHEAPDDAAVMHLDGDPFNLHVSNLEWRPRWFVNKWTRQRKQVLPRDNRSIRHVASGVVYPSALDCARAIGGLEDLVLLTAQSRWKTRYLGSYFEFIDD